MTCLCEPDHIEPATIAGPPSRAYNKGDDPHGRKKRRGAKYEHSFVFDKCPVRPK